MILPRRHRQSADKMRPYGSSHWDTVEHRIRLQTWTVQRCPRSVAQFVAPGVVIVQTCDEVEGAVLLPIAGAEGEEKLHREIGRPVDREPVAGPFAPPR